MDSDTSALDPCERLALDLDIRLHSTMLSALSEEELDDGLLAAYLRLAYASGYHDALAEPLRGQLLRQHGFAVPRRGEGRS